MRRPSATQALQKLRALGMPVGTVLDVGVLTGTHPLMKAFGDVPHLLIEPISEWYDTIRDKYGAAGIDYRIVPFAATDRDATLRMRTNSVREGQAITHAQLTDRADGDNLRDVEGRRLDTILAELRPQAPYLLKLDVDGVELTILDGAAASLPDCSVVMIEANVRNFAERTAYLVARGFQLYDIVELVYYDDRLRQFDLIFLNDAAVEAHGLDMYKQAFDISKWTPFQ